MEGGPRDIAANSSPWRSVVSSVRQIWLNFGNFELCGGWNLNILISTGRFRHYFWRLGLFVCVCERAQDAFHLRSPLSSQLVRPPPAKNSLVTDPVIPFNPCINPIVSSPVST